MDQGVQEGGGESFGAIALRVEIGWRKDECNDDGIEIPHVTLYNDLLLHFSQK